MGDFAHLHCHTEYSMLDGAARLDDLFTRCAELGMDSIAMTDHGNVFGAYEFWTKARAHGINPIIGMEAYLVPGSRHERKKVALAGGGGGEDNPGEMYTHMTLLAENTQGMHNLFRLSSLASLEGFYYKPRADRELLSTYAAGLIATTGCPSGEVARLLQRGAFDAACQAASDYRDIFGPQNYYCELMDHGIGIERAVRDDLIRLKKTLDLPGLATNDLHYVHATDAKAHEALLCVQTVKTMHDPKRFRFEAQDFYLKSPAQMRALWDAEVPEACDNTLAIAARCHVEFATRDLMPRFAVPAGHGEASWLTEATREGLALRYPDGVPPSHRQRADYELGVICSMGYAGYFLVVADVVRWAKGAGIVCGPGRGSAAGSLVAYGLGITGLDPIAHGLTFERFLNPERPSMPDIDLDFDDRRRGEVLAYVAAKYGNDRVAQIVTYSTIKAKSAIKDSARVLFDKPGYAIADRIVKAMPKAVAGNEIPLSAITDPGHVRYAEAAAVRALRDSDPQVAEILDTARGLENLKRQWGVHAAGVIVSNQALLDVLPIHRRPSDGAVITQFDMGTCEALGLLKMDFLGLRNLTIIADTLVNVTAAGKPPIDLETLSLADEATFALLGRGDTLGVFQLDSGPMRDLLRKMAPTRFADIVAVQALYRPGPMGTNAHNDYADRKNGRQEIRPIHPELAEPLADVLAETYALCVYQEDVLAIAQRVAGYTLGGADVLRRAMGKKKAEVLNKEYEKFAGGMRANGYSADAIKTLWGLLVPFSAYAFVKAHATAYGLIAYRTAYLKTHYPVEYMAALLTSTSDDKDRMAIYLAECRRLGITVLVPDVNASERDFTAVDGGIRFGLGAVRNIGDNVVTAIISVRTEGGAYTGFADFLRRIPPKACNREVIESLILAGAFDSLGQSRGGLHAVHVEAVGRVAKPKKARLAGQLDLFSAQGCDDLFDVAVPDVRWELATELAREREMLGLYVSGHPLRDIEHVLAARVDTPLSAVLEGSVTEGAVVTVGGVLAAVTRRYNRNGEPWAVLRLEDTTVGTEVVAFPKAYVGMADRLTEDAIVVIRARVNRRDDRLSLIAQGLEHLQASGVGESPVTVSVTPGWCTPARVAALGAVLARYPGSRQVRLDLGGGVVLRLAEMVAAGDDLRGECEALVGAGCVT